MKVGEYHYGLSGRHFRIYQCDYAENGITTSKPVDNEPLYNNREAARRRVYQLNGWNYKPKPTRAV